jgi:hypothetical protein
MSRDSSKYRCHACGLNKNYLIYLNPDDGRCDSCYITLRETLKSLIGSLPEATDLEAPLGWKFVDSGYFSCEKRGKAWADVQFHTRYFGGIN